LYLWKALGAIQAGVSSWAIHRLVLDEHFLIFMIGHAMYKKTKSIQEGNLYRKLILMQQIIDEDLKKS
jgi:hypothetical protein